MYFDEKGLSTRVSRVSSPRGPATRSKAFEPSTPRSSSYTCQHNTLGSGGGRGSSLTDGLQGKPFGPSPALRGRGFEEANGLDNFYMMDRTGSEVKGRPELKTRIL